MAPKKKSPAKASSPKERKATAFPSPGAATRSTTRQATPSGKKKAASTPSPSKATNRAPPAKVTKKASPTKGPSGGRPRGRPRKKQSPPEESEDDSDSDEGVVESIEPRSPIGTRTRSKSPHKQPTHKSPSRQTVPARQPSRSPAKLARAPDLSSPKAGPSHPTRTNRKSPGEESLPAASRSSRPAPETEADMTLKEIQQLRDSGYYKRRVGNTRYARWLQNVENQAFDARKKNGHSILRMPPFDAESVSRYWRDHAEDDYRTAWDLGVRNAHAEEAWRNFGYANRIREQATGSPTRRMPSYEQSAGDNAVDNPDAAGQAVYQLARGPPAQTGRLSPLRGAHSGQTLYADVEDDSVDSTSESGMADVQAQRQSMRSPTRRSLSPHKTSAPRQAQAEAARRFGQPSAEEGRGKVVPLSNPEYIPDKNGHPSDKKNPFFKKMPEPEIWHRNMPPFFPFGETPFMERVKSIEISTDLARSESSLL